MAPGSIGRGVSRKSEDLFWNWLKIVRADEAVSMLGVSGPILDRLPERICRAGKTHIIVHQAEALMINPAEAPEPTATAGRTDAAAAPEPSASRHSRLADLGPRIVSALILVAGAIATVLSGGLVFVLAWLAASLVVHFEWQRLVGGLRHILRFAPGSLAIIAAAIAANSNGSGLAMLLLVLGALASASLAEEGRRVWSAVGVIYAGSLFVSLSALRLSFPFGPRAIGWLFAVVWSTDVIAYFAGRLIGGPKFMPRVSPSKTWAGTMAGLLGGAAVGSIFLLLAAHVTRLDTPAPVWVLFLLGLMTAAVAQAGDLFESWTKRRFGAKDSGSLLPGHGGLLDRLDGFIAAAAWVTILGALRGFPSPAEGLFHWM